MRVARIVLVVVLGSCGDGRGGAPPARPGGAGGPSLADAEAFERGAGVARDYGRAADVYVRMCRDGRGDVEACRRLITSIAETRGVAFDRARLMDLSTALCLAAGDPQACALASVVLIAATACAQTRRICRIHCG